MGYIYKQHSKYMHTAAKLLRQGILQTV